MSDRMLKGLFLVGLSVASVIRARYTIRKGRRATGRRLSDPVDSLLLLLNLVGLQVLPGVFMFTRRLRFADYDLARPVRTWLGVLGSALLVAGCWGLRRSHVDLGRNWSGTLEIREDHSLVTDGVYSRIRHPMYASHFVLALGQACLLHNWIAGPAQLLAVSALYFYRAPREERMMLERFGDEYRAYSRRTGEIVPKFRR